MSEPTPDPARLFAIEARSRLNDEARLIRHCLNQLDDAAIWRRSAEGMNAIGNLLLHLAGNLRQRVEADVDRRPDARDRFGEFTARSESPKAELLRRFDESVAAVDARLASLAPGELTEIRPFRRLDGATEATVMGILFLAITHLAGHAREIVHMTRTLLGDRYEFQSPALVPPEMRPKR